MKFRKMLLFIRKFLLGLNPAKVDEEYFDAVTGAVNQSYNCSNKSTEIPEHKEFSSWRSRLE